MDALSLLRELDKLGVTYTTRLVIYGCESAKTNELDRRAKRMMVKAFKGTACGVSKGMLLRWFVLTESDEAIAMGLDFGKTFHRLFDWLRYSCPDVQYLVVEHCQGDKTRRNWHVLTYGSDKLPMKAIEAWWMEHYLSHTGKFELVKYPEKAIRYLAGYMSNKDKFVRSWASQGWIYSGWSKTSYEYKKTTGKYLDTPDVVKLAKMPQRMRQTELEYLVNTGDYSSCFESIKNV